MTTAEPLSTIQQYRKGAIDLESATLKVALFDDSTSYSVDRLNHNFVADVLDGGTTAQELNDSSYSRESVTNLTVTVDSTDEEVVVDADDVVFSNLDGGETIQGWILYEQTGTDDQTPGDDRIIAVQDDFRNSNGNKITTNGSDVTVQLDTEGLINIA